MAIDVVPMPTRYDYDVRRKAKGKLKESLAAKRTSQVEQAHGVQEDSENQKLRMMMMVMRYSDRSLN